MKKFSFILFCLLTLSICAQAEPAPQMLKPGQPHWRSKVVETFPSGMPSLVIFSEKIGKNEEVAVKKRGFYPNGQIKFEMDLASVEEDSPAAKEWGSTTVPHGVAIWLYEDGRAEKIAHYHKGVMNGDLTLYYPNGSLKGTCSFAHGKRNGKMVVYYEDGLKSEEATYVEDKLVGDVVRYYPKNIRAQLVPHEEGVPHGHAMEWYESGGLKASRRFDRGLLNSDGKNPAVIIYNEDHGIQEVQDFQQGEPVGVHLKYHPNGKESYKVAYKEGKRDGRELFFSQEGKLLGEGFYQLGLPTGKHWRNHENGNLAFSAEFDDQGKLLRPIEEFYENGNRKASYTFVDQKLHGNCCEWYENGAIKSEYHYVHGDFEGAQKEYYPHEVGETPLLKMKTFYRNKVQDGLYEEWHPNGQIAVQVSLQGGVRHGPSKEWFENGQPKIDEQFAEGKLDQMRRQWYANGNLQFEGLFSKGEKESLHREWNEKGDLIGQASYTHDLLNGEMKVWFEKDRLQKTGHFALGKKEGVAEEFYANGQLKAKATYYQDQLDGTVETFYEDGSPFQLFSYKLGLPIGIHQEFFKPENRGEEGKISKIMRFNDLGQAEGQHQTFYPSGITQSLIHFKEGELHGLKSMWNPEGDLIEEYEYQAGQLNGRTFQKLPDGREVIFHYQDNQKHGIHEIFFPPNEMFGKKKAVEAHFVADKLEGDVIEFDEAGNTISVANYVNGVKEGFVQLFNPKGELMAKIGFSEDKKQGPAVEYYPGGQIAREVSYVSDEKEGDEKGYFPNGKPQLLIPYRQGKIDGLYQQWNEDGVLVFEAEYRHGLRHGKFTKYYDDGKPMIIQNFVDDQLDGIKKSFDPSGKVTETRWKLGKRA